MNPMLSPSEYAIALQQAIEHACHGKPIPDSIAKQCPHHAMMLSFALRGVDKPANKEEKRDATFVEYVLDTIGTTDMACVLGLIRAASEARYAMETGLGEDDFIDAIKNLHLALSPFGSKESLHLACKCCGYAERVPKDDKWRMCPKCQTICETDTESKTATSITDEAKNEAARNILARLWSLLSTHRTYWNASKNMASLPSYAQCGLIMDDLQRCRELLTPESPTPAAINCK